MLRERPKCKFCGEEFDLGERLPHMISRCGHSICEWCITKLSGSTSERCVECNVDISFENFRERFPPNHGLISLMKTEPKASLSNGQQTQKFINSECKIHRSRPFVVCVDPCQKKVCCECGLFGEHRNHLMLNEEEFSKLAQEKQDSLRKNLESVGQLESYVKTKFFKTKVLDALERKKLAVSSELVKAFNLIALQVSKEKARLVEETEKYFGELGQFLASKFETVFSFMEGVSQWRDEIEHLLANPLEQKSSFDYFISLINSEDIKRLFNDGKAFSSRMASGIETLETILDESIQEVRLENRFGENTQLVFVNLPHFDTESIMHDLNTSSISNLGSPKPFRPSILDVFEISPSPARRTGSFHRESHSRIDPLYENTIHPDSTQAFKRMPPVYKPPGSRLSQSFLNQGRTSVKIFSESKVNTPRLESNRRLSLYPKLLGNKLSIPNSNEDVTSLSVHRSSALQDQKDIGKLKILVDHMNVYDKRWSEDVVSVHSKQKLTSRGPEHDVSIARTRRTSRSRDTIHITRDEFASEAKLPRKRIKLEFASPLKNKPREPLENSSPSKILKEKLGDIVKNLTKNQLTILDISENEIRDADLQVISAFLPIAKGLKTIKLSRNFIGDEGIKTLCGAISGLNVQSIDLSGNSITNEGLGSLLKFANSNRRLRLLNMRRNQIDSKVRERFAAEFKTAGVAVTL